MIRCSGRDWKLVAGAAMVIVLGAELGLGPGPFWRSSGVLVTTPGTKKGWTAGLRDPIGFFHFRFSSWNSICGFKWTRFRNSFLSHSLLGLIMKVLGVWSTVLKPFEATPAFYARGKRSTIQRVLLSVCFFHAQKTIFLFALKDNVTTVISLQIPEGLGSAQRKISLEDFRRPEPTPPKGQ